MINTVQNTTSLTISGDPYAGELEKIQGNKFMGRCSEEWEDQKVRQ